MSEADNSYHNYAGRSWSDTLWSCAKNHEATERDKKEGTMSGICSAHTGFVAGCSLCEAGMREMLLMWKADLEFMGELTTTERHLKIAIDYALALEARLKRAEDALEFYADPGTYFAIGFFPDRPCGDFMEDFDETEFGMKPGKMAREALKGFGKEVKP